MQNSNKVDFFYTNNPPECPTCRQVMVEVTDKNMRGIGKYYCPDCDNPFAKDHAKSKEVIDSQ